MNLISHNILNESAKSLLGKYTNMITIPGRVSKMTSRKYAFNLHRIEDGNHSLPGSWEGVMKKSAFCSELERSVQNGLTTEQKTFPYCQSS